jgi:hypothetical protein
VNIFLVGIMTDLPILLQQVAGISGEPDKLQLIQYDSPKEALLELGSTEIVYDWLIIDHRNLSPQSERWEDSLRHLASCKTIVIPRGGQGIIDETPKTKPELVTIHGEEYKKTEEPTVTIYRFEPKSKKKNTLPM